MWLTGLTAPLAKEGGGVAGGSSAGPGLWGGLGLRKVCLGKEGCSAVNLWL